MRSRRAQNETYFTRTGNIVVCTCLQVFHLRLGTCGSARTIILKHCAGMATDATRTPIHSPILSPRNSCLNTHTPHNTTSKPQCVLASETASPLITAHRNQQQPKTCPFKYGETSTGNLRMVRGVFVNTHKPPQCQPRVPLDHLLHKVVFFFVLYLWLRWLFWVVAPFSHAIYMVRM